MNDRRETLFLSLGLALSAVLLAAGLLLNARTAARSDQCVAAKEEVLQLRRENESLRARCACSLCLEEIRRYAEEELGMQQLSAEQMVVLPAAG